MMKECFITTFDNPFNYFTQFDQWLAFDRINGYYTLELIGRLARLAPDLSEEEEDSELERVFDFIIEWHGDLYHKVYKDSKQNE